MTFLNIYRFLKGLAAISGLSALISIAITFWSDQNLKAESEKQRWREGIVYSLIMRSGQKGLAHDVLLSSYTSELANSPFKLTKDDLKDLSLDLTLVSLMQKYVITFRTDNVFVINSTSKFASEYDEMSSTILKLNDSMLSFVIATPGTLNIEGLRALIKQQYPNSSNALVESAIDYFLRSYGRLDNGKIILRTNAGSLVPSGVAVTPNPASKSGVPATPNAASK